MYLCNQRHDLLFRSRFIKYHGKISMHKKDTIVKWSLKSGSYYYDADTWVFEGCYCANIFRFNYYFGQSYLLAEKRYDTMLMWKNIKFFERERNMTIEQNISGAEMKAILFCNILFCRSYSFYNASLMINILEKDVNFSGKSNICYGSIYSCSKQISICLTFRRKFLCNLQGLYFSMLYSFIIWSILRNFFLWVIFHCN